MRGQILTAVGAGTMTLPRRWLAGPRSCEMELI
jgi:hypothetical protein